MAEAKGEDCRPGGRERTRRHLPAQKLKACKNSPTHRDLTLTPIRALNEASCSAPLCLCAHSPHRGAGRVKGDLREPAQCLAQGKSSQVPCLSRPSPTLWTRHWGASALAQAASDPPGAALSDANRTRTTAANCSVNFKFSSSHAQVREKKQVK